MTKDTPSPSVPGAMAMTPEAVAARLRKEAEVGIAMPWNLIAAADLIDRLRAQVRACEKARAEALEEAAIAAETVSHAPNYDPGPPNDKYSHGFNMGRQAAADAVRTLPAATPSTDRQQVR